VKAESESFPIRADHNRALIGSWYEFFPRSEGAIKKQDGEVASGTFATATKRLPGVAAMGFDVLYLPPVHPIGYSHRKGKNNSLEATASDCGVPWAIGNADGGHDAMHLARKACAHFVTHRAVNKPFDPCRSVNDTKR
jgi:starch synthase (maltosyl-transferring)